MTDNQFKTDMKRFLAIAAAVLALTACGKSAADKLAEAISKVTVECEPSVLEVVENSIKANLTVNYPAGYFSKDAMVVVSPVLVYEGGEMAGMPFTYQGEGVKLNNKVVPTTGGTVREKVDYPFVPGMEKSHLELRTKAFIGGKEVNIPVIKVADGCINTVALADFSGAFDYKPDNYQEVISQFTEGQIHYDVNSSNVKGTELRNQSIQELTQALQEGKESERVTVKGTKIISYASPEGGQEYNSKLSDKRSDAAMQAWKTIGKGAEAGSTEVQSIGQDWEGFKEAISKSNLEDKDLILRVLSMYSDPAVRESEIKNLSQVYTEIKEQVFPELRRSRFITEMEYQNYTEADLKRLMDRKKLYLLDEEAVLHLAAMTDSLDEKQTLYRAAADRMGSQRGLYNIGAVLLAKDSPAAAEVYFNRMEDQNDPDLLNALGVVKMRKGELEEAAKLFGKSGNASAIKNLGAIALRKGDYAKAADILKGTGGKNEAVADILTGKYEQALQALGDCKCADTDYLRAVISARLRKATDVKKYLDAAFAKNPALREQAAKDIEFAGFDF